MTDLIEYKVRKVTRFIVTRFCDMPNDHMNARGTKFMGEFGNQEQAYEVGYALAFKEREDLGWPPGDERMQFPQKAGE